MFTPLNKHVVVRPAESNEKSKGGLYIPTEARKSSPQGVVEAVDDEVTRLSKGQTVIYRKWSEILINGETLHIVAYEDVMGIVEVAS